MAYNSMDIRMKTECSTPLRYDVVIKLQDV